MNGRAGVAGGGRLSTVEKIVYRHRGCCPICESPAEFSARHEWYRDHLLCSDCGSIPRERALALVLNRMFPDWRNFSIHESSPIERGISLKLRKHCRNYVATQYFPNNVLGGTIRGFRNETLEAQTFPGESFDLVVSLDVMEHVNKPELCFKEIERTLKPGGSYLFTVPTYKGKITSERRALYREDGTVVHIAEPEYHGNPVSDAGSLVTFHYGYDLPELIKKWSHLDVEVYRFHHHRFGIIGDFSEVYLASKAASSVSSDHY